jgi:hypothetical protein
LAAVYLAVVEQVNTLGTAGMLFDVIRKSTDSRIDGRLKPIRSVFGGELEKVLPNDPAAVLTAEQKGQAAIQLKRFAAVLGAVK